MALMPLVLDPFYRHVVRGVRPAGSAQGIDKNPDGGVLKVPTGPAHWNKLANAEANSTGTVSSYQERFEMPQNFRGPLLSQIVTALDGTTACLSRPILPT